MVKHELVVPYDLGEYVWNKKTWAEATGVAEFDFLLLDAELMFLDSLLARFQLTEIKREYDQEIKCTYFDVRRSICG